HRTVASVVQLQLAVVVGLHAHTPVRRHDQADAGGELERTARDDGAVALDLDVHVFGALGGDLDAASPGVHGEASPARQRHFQLLVFRGDVRCATGGNDKDGSVLQ